MTKMLAAQLFPTNARYWSKKDLRKAIGNANPILKPINPIPVLTAETEYPFDDDGFL